MGKHKHHIIPVYHCKELGIDPDFDENIVEVDRLDHARIHWGYKCDDLEPLFEYITPAQWIIDLIPRGDSRDVGAAVLTAKGELDEIDMSGENNPMYGKKNTEEQKEHKRQVLLKQWQIPIEDGGRKGWKPTEEMNRHNSETKKQLYAAGILVPSMKGKTQSEETKKKIGDKARGRTHSEETLKKMSETRGGPNGTNVRNGITFAPIEEQRKHHNDKGKARRNATDETREAYNKYMREYNAKNLTREIKDETNRKRKERRAKKKSEGSTTAQGEGNLDPFLRYADNISHDIPEYPIFTHIK
jgi:hypothetical protein